MSVNLFAQWHIVSSQQMLAISGYYHIAQDTIKTKDNFADQSNEPFPNYEPPERS